MIGAIIRSILFSPLGAGVTVGSALVAWNLVIDNPGIVREQRAICLEQVRRAAAEATRDEQLRQFRLGEWSTDQAIREDDEAQRAHRAAITKIMEGARSYAAERMAEGRAACTITERDLDYLDGGIVLDDKPAD